MKLELNNKIKAYIDAYHTNCESQGEAIRKVLEPFKTPSFADRFTQEGLKQTIKEQTDIINSNWKKYDTTLNQQVKTAIEDAKNKLLKALHIHTTNKPDDYAIKIANAREFMKDELEHWDGGRDANMIAELDSSLALILKDFIDDYDTIKLFSKMVEKKVLLIGAMGECVFPKTFGKMMKIDSIMNTLNEVDEAATMIFIHARNNGEEVVRIKGDSFAIPMDGYSQMADEQAILNNSTILDELAENINEDGHAQYSGEGQKIDVE